MKIILLNDTTNNQHYGCFAVSNALRRYLHKRDDVEVLPIFNRQLKYDYYTNDIPAGQRQWLIDCIKWADLVVVNGEGTIHHNRAPELEVAIRLAIEHRVPFCLVNSIFEDYPGIVGLLSHAEFVSLRDASSLAEAKTYGLACVRCTDAAVYANFEQALAPLQTSKTCITDWHNEATAIAHGTIANHIGNHNSFYLPFHDPNAFRTWPTIINRLSAFNEVVCGRYHGAIFSMLSGRPIVLLPSNSRKIRALAEEFDFEAIWGGHNEPVFRLSSQKALDAQKKLLEMRADETMHPLHALQLGARRYPIRNTSHHSLKPTHLAGSLQLDIEKARTCVDELQATETPLPRKKRLVIEANMKAASPQLLSKIAALLMQEHRPLLSQHTLGPLCHAGWSEVAHETALALLNRCPGHTEAATIFASLDCDIGQAHTSNTFFSTVHLRVPLSAKLALKAARSASRIRDYRQQYDYLRSATTGGLGSDPNQLVELAIAASRSGVAHEAMLLSRRALEDFHVLEPWPRMLAGITLAANGDFVAGCEAMSSALNIDDPIVQRLRRRSSTIFRGKTVYIPSSIGVGSAILGLLSLAQSNVDTALRVIVDPRLHPLFRRVLGGKISLVSPAQLTKHFYGQVTNIFDFLKTINTAEKSSAGYKPTFRPDEDLADRFRKKYTELFKGKRCVGLAWSSINARTGQGRNLTIIQTRELLDSCPDIRFISLQAGVQHASRDALHINRHNLLVDTDVDPIQSIEQQLAQISVLDAVVSIDCTALHFAGGLGKRSVGLLTGEPTWQWPSGESFYPSINVLKKVDYQQIKALIDN